MGIASGYLAKLKAQLSDYQLEERMLDAAALEQTANPTLTTNSTGNLFDSVRGEEAPVAAALDGRTATREIELLKLQREKLSRHLRPKHPKMVKLDADIERSRKGTFLLGEEACRTRGVTKSIAPAWLTLAN